MLRLKSTARQSGPTPSIDMTPMVDMVFLLLIFFLLTSMAITQPVLNLTLPKASHSEKSGGGEGIRLVIRKWGTVEVDQEPIAINGLDARLKQKVADNNEKKIFLSADENAPFGLFVQVLDILHDLKLNKLSILTQSEKDVQ